VSVTVVYFVEMSKHILKLFSPSDSHTVLFSVPTLLQQSNGPLSGGVEYRWGIKKL